MLTFHAPLQSGHAPERELHNGDWSPFAESPARVDSMIAAMEKVHAPADFGKDAILAVHDGDYVNFLETAHNEWLAAGRTGDAVGYTFPIVRRRKLSPKRIDAKLGLYGFDAATPIASGTWDATYWSAQSALAGINALASGDARQAFALCRPPGHHAGADYCGGYCYLNAAAIAAREAQRRGMGKIAVLDVDYHHGNGTQDIFYEDGSVFFASIHADPQTDYPFFWGHADETGEGGGIGTTRNFPLARGTDWSGYEPALDAAIAAITQWGAQGLVVSYGADIFAGDPISFFKLTTSDMQSIGAKIGAMDLPTLTVMEGGYAVEALGANVAAFLEGIESA